MANSCKFQKTQYQVSYDNGTTWEDVVPTQFAKGELIEYDSPDCNGIDTNYRWRTLEGQYLCDGNKKYTKQIQEESYDNGETWYVSYPTIYRGGEYVGEDDEFCCDKFIGHYIYVEPTPTCQSGYYWNGVRCVRNSSGGVPSGLGPKYYYDPLKVIKCDGNGSLTTADTSYYTINYSLLSAEIGDSVTSIGYAAFAHCGSLTSINLPNSVVNIGDEAFSHCGSLANIVIPSGVTSINTSTFEHCYNFTNINIPNSVTSIASYAFSCCSNLTSITIPNSVISIGDNAFEYCRNLTDITIGSNITSIGNEAFNFCSGLTSITVEATTPPEIHLNTFGYTNNCPIFVPNESINLYKSANYWNNYADRIQAIT